MNNKFTRSLLALTVLTAASNVVMAEEETSPFSGNVTIVSDYLFDGVSQTDNGPALQGAFDFVSDFGLYAGVWASNVDFGDDTNLEVDLYAGFSFGESIVWDFGIARYNYLEGLSSEGEIDYNEYYAGVTVADITLKYWYADDYGGSELWASRMKASYSVTFSDALSMPLEYTYTKPSAELGDSFSSYKVGLATSLSDFGLEVSVQKTTVDDEGDRATEDKFCTKACVVFAVSRDF